MRPICYSMLVNPLTAEVTGENGYTRRCRSETGTTLLEVMVAMAVASLALVSFITLVVSSMDLEEVARNITEATIAADKKLKEVESNGYPEVGKTEGLVEGNRTHRIPLTMWW